MKILVFFIYLYSSPYAYLLKVWFHMFQTLRYNLCQQLAWQLTQLAYSIYSIAIEKIVIEKIYISISICLLKGIYVSIQSSKLFDRVKQLYMN